MCYFDEMSDLDMHFHLLNTRIFKESSDTGGKNLCALIKHLNATMTDKKKDNELLKTWDLCQHKALNKTFEELGLDDSAKQRGHQIFNQHFDRFKEESTPLDGKAEDIVR